MADLVWLVRALAGLWWAGSLFVLLLSFAGAAIFPRRFVKLGRRSDLPPLTAITPIKSDEPGFAQNLASLFAQDYPDIEIVIAASHADRATLDIAGHVRAAHPAVTAVLEDRGETRANSPKLNNLWQPIARAGTDIVVTKDSNVRLAPDDLRHFVNLLSDDVGLVSTILAARDAESFPGWIETSIINGYQARMLMMTAVAGFGFGCGKIMLSRRSNLERAGGLASLQHALGEDSAIAHAMQSQGLRAIFADRVSFQTIGQRRLKKVWERQLRWMLIRRTVTPIAFCMEILGLALPTSLAGAFAALLIGVSPAVAGLATLALWFGVEVSLSLIKGWRLSAWSPLAFLGREVLLSAAWLRAWTTNTVSWDGTRCVMDSARAAQNPRTIPVPGNREILPDGA